MKVKCSISIKTIITSILVGWFLFRGLQTYMRIYRPDYRLEQLGTIQQQPFSQDATGIYLRKIENRFKMENFELIEMMNQTNPNLISDDAMLVISASHNSVQYSYAHLLQKIEQSNEGNSRLPFYLLRKAKSLLMQNSKEIKMEVDEIVKVLEYFSQFLLIKRLTILSFEEGSLLCLRSLAFIKYDVFSMIDKLILINPFNPTIMIFHGNSASFLEETKQKILADPVRTQLTNHTRIIIIHTIIDNNEGDHKINWLFKNSQGEKITFANSLLVSSKLLWNVYSYLKPEQYFRFEPFNEIITKLFNEDRQYGPLSIKAIQYLLLYRETSMKKEMSTQNRNKLLAKCMDYYMQNYNRDGVFFNIECIRVLRKEDFYFNQNTSVIVKSQGKFEIYGQNYERLFPYDTKGKQTIFLLENVLEYRRFFIINKKKHTLQLIIQPTLSPKIMKLNWEGKKEFQTDLFSKSKELANSNHKPVRMCSGISLLYPANYLSGLLQGYISQSSLSYYNDCFTGVEIYMLVVRNLYENWSLGCNLIIFSLFCFHIVKKSTFSRFYYQLLINYTLTFLHTGQSLFCDNLIILSIVVIIEQLLRFIVMMADMIYMPKNLAIKVMWVPLVLQILKWLDVNIFFSPWKAIGLLFFAGTHKHNIVVLFLQFLFIMEYVIRDISNAQGLFLCCAWLAFSSIEQNQQPKIPPISNDIIVITTGKRLKSIKMTVLALRKQIVNTVTVCIIAMCLAQDGIVMHFIIDFYITTYVIFAVHQHLEDLT